MSARLIAAALAAIAVGVVLAGRALATDDPPPLPCDTPVVGTPGPPDGWAAVTDCGTPPEGLAGQADMRSRTVTVWPAAHTRPDALVWTWLHELGHAYDAAVLDDDGRDRWRELRGLPDGPWQHLHSGPELDRQAWRNAPGEDFAEAFAFCHRRDADRVRIPGFILPDEAACELVLRLTDGGAS
jgi:hypothetical protein